VQKEGRLLLEKAWSIHKEAGREEYKLEHLASIKYSLAGAGVAVRNLQGVPVMPKENLEGALQDFESQLQEYNLPVSPRLAHFAPPEGCARAYATASSPWPRRSSAHASPRMHPEPEP